MSTPLTPTPCPVLAPAQGKCRCSLSFPHPFWGLPLLLHIRAHQAASFTMSSVGDGRRKKAVTIINACPLGMEPHEGSNYQTGWGCSGSATSHIEGQVKRWLWGPWKNKGTPRNCSLSTVAQTMSHPGSHLSAGKGHNPTQRAQESYHQQVCDAAWGQGFLGTPQHQ